MSGFEIEPMKELEPWAREMLDQEKEAPQASKATEPEAKAAEPAPAAPKAPETEVDAMLQRMDILQPGDFKAVASLIEMHPELRDRILARAQEVCGNDTVVKALDLLQAPKEEPATAKSEPEKTPEPPKPADAVDIAAGVAPATKAPTEEFVYALSPLALQPTSVSDHIEFIKNNPQLRDQVMSGAAQLDPKLAAEVEQALATSAPPAADVTPEPVIPVEAAPQPTAEEIAAQNFDYTMSYLNLEYNETQKIQDHIDFIRQNPLLRDKVLMGAGEYYPALADEVRKGLAKPPPQTSTSDAEPTPSAVIEASAAAAAPHAAQEVTKVAPTEAPKAEAPKTPEGGWVARARDFNGRHDAQAAQFIELTGGTCLDETGQLDPNLVANWQAANGLDADGRIGDATVGAAINVAPSWAEAAKMAEVQELPAPDPLDPAFAQ